jgi:hypothetical protein
MSTDLSRARRAAPLAIALFLAGYGCGSTNTSSVSAPSQLKCQVAVAGSSASFPPQGGNGSVSINATRDCAWSANSSASWIQLSVARGQGEGQVRYSVRENNSTNDRAGDILLSSGQRVRVRQAGAPPPPPPPPPPPAPPPPAPPAPPPTESGPEIDLDGEISGLLGVCPNLVFRLEGRTVRTGSATEFRKLECADLRDGRDVDVKGTVQSDGSVFATRIERD